MSQAFAEALGRVPMSHVLAATLARAYDYARHQAHRAVMLEHLLLALCEDEDAGPVLKACNVDLASLSAESSAFVGRIEDRVPGVEISTPVAATELVRILEYATAAAHQSRRREINGAIVLAAIVGEGRSPAAHILRAHGLTFDEAIKALQRATAAAQQAAPVRPLPVNEAQSPAGMLPPPPPTRPEPARAAAPQPPSAEQILATVRERIQAGRAHAPAAPAFPSHPSPSPSHPSELVAAPEPGPRGHHLDHPAELAPPAVAHRPADTLSDAASYGPASASVVAEPHSRGPLPAIEDLAHDRAVPPHGRSPQAAPRAAGGSHHAPPYHAGPSHPAPPTSYLPEPDRRPTSPEPAAHVEGPLPRSPGHLPPVPPAPFGAPPPRHQDITRPPSLPTVPPPAPPPHAVAPPPPRRSGGPQWPEAGPATPGSVPSDAPMRRSERTHPPALDALQAGAPPRGRPAPAAGMAPPQRGHGLDRGQLLENIPRVMRVGVSASVEVRIARADLQNLGAGLDGRGAPVRHDLVITKAMSVRLRAPDGGFWIETASPETQWIESRLGIPSDDYASWRWTVTPQQRGAARLQLIVAARTVGTDGLAAESALPEQMIEVTVRTNIARTAGRLVGWVIAAAVGGVLARFGDTIWATGAQMVRSITGG